MKLLNSMLTFLYLILIPNYSWASSLNTAEQPQEVNSLAEAINLSIKNNKLDIFIVFVSRTHLEDEFFKKDNEGNTGLHHLMLTFIELPSTERFESFKVIYEYLLEFMSENGFSFPHQNNLDQTPLSIIEHDRLRILSKINNPTDNMTDSIIERFHRIFSRYEYILEQGKSIALRNIKSEANSVIECPICFEEVQNHQFVPTSYSCCHFICRKCYNDLKQQLPNDFKCPICRGKLD